MLGTRYKVLGTRCWVVGAGGSDYIGQKSEFREVCVELLLRFVRVAGG